MRRLSGTVLLAICLPWFSYAISFVNGSSTVGTLVGPGLAVVASYHDISFSDVEVLASSRSFVTPLAFHLTLPSSVRSLATYFELNDVEALELRAGLEAVQLGDLKGYSGILDDSYVWLVPNSKGLWILFVANDANAIELMDELMSTLHYPDEN